MINRRDFLKTNLQSIGALAFSPIIGKNIKLQQEWPSGQQLGRNCVDGILNLRVKPSANAAVVGKLYEDSVVVWLREVIGEAPAGVLSRRWVETPQGYLYAPSIQPVMNIPNKPIAMLPIVGEDRGMWAEVTVPFVEIVQENPPARSPWLKEITKPRLYYSQVMWVNDIKTNSNGQVMYRIDEKYGTYGDVFWGSAESFRQITEEEISPINPESEEKKIIVDINHQTLTCYEGNQEVYFCRISSGAKFDYQGQPLEDYATPLGPHPIWRKLVSIHMSGGGTGSGWDTPGIAWTSLFVGEGVAIHSTFWHNDFGTPRSHGCVNASADDAKWIFRWTLPKVPYNPGDITVQMPGGSIVTVVEG